MQKIFSQKEYFVAQRRRKIIKSFNFKFSSIAVKMTAMAKTFEDNVSFKLEKDLFQKLARQHWPVP